MNRLYSMAQAFVEKYNAEYNCTLCLQRFSENGFSLPSFPQLFYPLMTRQFFCDFHEKSEDFCVS